MTRLLGSGINLLVNPTYPTLIFAPLGPLAEKLNAIIHYGYFKPL